MLRKDDSVRKIHGHQCTLPFRDEQVNYLILDGLLVQFRRKIRKWFTVSSANPASKKILKSTAQIQLEELRHLTKYYYMIHPFSKARFFWEMFMIPVLLLLYFLIPLEVSLPRAYEPVLYTKFFLDIVSFVDIILFFFTGYFNMTDQKVVMNCRRVAKHYVLGYFLFDVISSQPISMYLYIFNKPELKPLKLIMLLKLVRLPTLINYLYKFAERMNFWNYKIKFFCFTLWIAILILWATSVIFLVVSVKKEHDDDFSQKTDNIAMPMLLTCFVVVRAFMAVGITEVGNNRNWEMLFQITCLIFGSLLKVVILAKVMQIYRKVTSSRSKYNSLVEQVGEFMKYKELPARLKEKVFNYVHFKFQKHIFKEDDILKTLSSVLKQDILLQTCQTMVEKVDFFKGIPTSVMLRIVTKLRSEIYLANDVVVLAGYAGHAMYFIYMGTVAVYTSTGKEICHLEDGGHFGEIALVINEPRVATVVAVKECELFKLGRKEFQEAIEPFPELTKKIRQLALTRLENTMKMMEDQDESAIVSYNFEDERNQDQSDQSAT